MIKPISLSFIGFYQRFLSPVKGFNCAHHRLHQGDTCSNAIKKIIIENPLRDIPKLSKARFNDCKNASLELTRRHAIALQRADLPCDVGCVGDIGCLGDLPGSDCGNTDGGCASPCDLVSEFVRLKRRTQIILMSILVIMCLAFAYYYGSQTTKLEITQLSNSQRSDGFFKKLITRNSPSLRAVVNTQAGTYYSDIVESASLDAGKVVTLNFSRAFSVYQLRQLKLQDARLSAAQDLIVVGQTIATIESPGTQGRSKRFQYKFKSRWGF